MNVSTYIARRYLISRKSTNVINIISGISVFGILFCTAALIILLSAFNGLEGWVVRLYSSFDPDLKVMSAQGRFFHADTEKYNQIKAIKGVKSLVEVIEENGLVSYRDAQYVCTIKGVNNEFLNNPELLSQMTDGRFSLERANKPAALLGLGVAYALSANLNDISIPLDLYVPKADFSGSLNPAEAFHSAHIFPSGFFEVQSEYDSKYLIVPLEFARELFAEENKLSSLEIKFEKGADYEVIRRKVQDILGSGYKLSNRFEQHEMLYKIINSEKWAVFLIGVFILLVAAFNITGTLTMLIVDKTRDVGTLRSLGLSRSGIRSIFFQEGLLVSLTGLFFGIVLGTIVVLVQKYTGWVKINAFDAYPVAFNWKDFVLVFITVSLISVLASWFPSGAVYRRYNLRER